MNLPSTSRTAISRGLSIGIVIVLILAAIGAIYYVTLPGPSLTTTPTPTTSSTGSSSQTSSSQTSTSQTSTSQSSTTSTSSVSTTGAIPSTIIYETPATPQYLDTGVSYFSYDFTLFQQNYEQLLFYNGTNSGSVVPWLAQGYTASPDGKSYQFTLRTGIKFQDGETLNSSAVFFSLNRLLIEDASTPTAHGSQASWILQQLLNKSLSTQQSGSAQTYGTAYVNKVLAENFVKITGPNTFTINVVTPNAAFPFLMAGEWASIIAPTYVMQKDLAMWSQSSNGYTLPYPNPGGSFTNKMTQYFADLSSTCNAGVTPGGCATTYLDGSASGSLAGTGPYIMTSYSSSTNNFVFTANPGYWGGPQGNIHAKITTINVKYVGDINTRELDLQNAAKSGQAMAIDPDTTHLYDLADRQAWLNHNTLKSTVPGVTLYGAYSGLSTLFDPFDTNVTSVITGNYYSFQPFADRRLRLAFSDAINITNIMNTVNNKLGQTAINVVAPGLPPAGSYFKNDTPAYSFNLHQVQALLLDAMQHPLKNFKFTNGTAAPAGLFNNAFGCSTLNAHNQCDNPVPQNIQMVFGIGDTVDEAIFDTIAGNINNVSATYNMGLTASVVPLPTGQLLNEAFATPTHLYFYALGWFADYPWVLDFTNAMYAPANTYPGPDGWNLAVMGTLFQKSQADSAANNLPALNADVNKMNIIANNAVMYLWTQYPLNFMAMTSNIQGFYYNPALSTSAAGGTGPEIFATLY